MIVIVGSETSRLYEQTTPFKLAECSGFEFSRYVPKPPRREDNVLIRYGKTSYANREWRYKKIINTASSIELASNKLESLLQLERNGIPIPKMFLRKSEITQRDLPVIRRRAYHSRGSDIILVNALYNIPNGDYYSKLIDSKSEYRVHVFNGEVIRIQLKIKDSERESEMDEFVHNFENGYVLSDTYTHDLEVEKSILQLSIDAVGLLGLTFGAVDVLIDKDNNPYVLEVNSAPRLNKYGRQLYTLYFYKLLGWDISQFKNRGRIRENKGANSNGLPVEFREIIT